MSESDCSGESEERSVAVQHRRPLRVRGRRGARPRGRRRAAPTAAPTRELDERSTRLAHALRRAAASAPATTSALYLRNSRRAPRGDARLLQAARGSDQRELPLRRRRARVPAATTPTLVALVPRRRVRDRAAASRSRCPRVRLVLDVDDADVRRAASPPASPARDLGPRSRRRPLRALHRRHDRAARRASCGARRTSSSARSAAGTPAARRSPRPTQIAASVLDNPAQRLRAVPARRATPGPTQFVSLALGPLMHASGQWSALGTLLGGGKVVLYDRAARRHGARARPRRARARQRDATSSATRARARCSPRSPRNPAAGTRRRCGCSARAAASSRAT